MTIPIYSNTYLVAELCHPTLLSLTAEGTTVDGLGARLTISLGDRSLFDDTVTSPISLELLADEPGWLLIAFTNDLYRPPEDRNLILRDVELLQLVDGAPLGSEE